MLRLVGMTLTDFGPFKGRQEIVFPTEDGVTVVYGENMRGKTTLLNAIRYAFFGRILGRNRRAGSLHNLGNWISAEAGGFGFEVTLDLSYEGQQYRLTRTCRPRSGVTPQSDDDYSPTFYLERNGHVLGPQASIDELNRILPEQISRFFLFDGELLQEYEDLLHNDSDMGPRISDAIERILGMPVLTGARDGMKAAQDRAENRQALAAQGSQKTRELGNQLQGLVEERNALEQDAARLTKDLEEQRAVKAETEEEMRKRERLASLLDKRDRLEADIKDLQSRLGQQKDKLTAAMAQAWPVLLLARMATSTTRLKAREATLQTTVTRAHILRSLAEGNHADCPTCMQAIDAAGRNRIRHTLESSVGTSVEAEERELSEVRRQIDALAKHASAAKPEVLRELWDSVAQIDRDIYQKRGEIEELSRQLDDGKEADVRRLRSTLEAAIRAIKDLEDGIEATRDKLVKNVSYREGIQKKLDRSTSGGSLVIEAQIVKIASDLYALFSEGVKVFREQLRRRVEADATKHFLTLTTEPEYKALRINDSYGLTIIHDNGSEVPVRSAGAEHIVALSLVGALQNNAPLRGPIIIDSPFGRLDAGHKARVVAALPNMASEVVLLVYEEELPPARAREVLKGKLRAEWNLKRLSARHTELALREEDLT